MKLKYEFGVKLEAVQEHEENEDFKSAFEILIESIQFFCDTVAEHNGASAYKVVYKEMEEVK